MNAEPKCVDLPGVPRSLDLIDPVLRAKMREVINGREPWPLFIHGPPGIGKTCSALCIVDRCHRTDERKELVFDDGNWRLPRNGEQTQVAWVSDQPSAVYCVLRDVCEMLSGEWRTKGKEKTTAFWNQWDKARLGVVDEIGTQEKVANFVFDATFKLIDERQKQGKPLIVISNLSLQELAKLYDDRLTSRLGSGTVVKLEGEDRRLAR